MQQVGVPSTSFWVSHPCRNSLSYVELISYIIDAKHSSYEESTRKQVLRHVIVEHDSFIKNVIVSRLEQKPTLDSKVAVQLKHVVDGSIEKHKVQFVAILLERGLCMRRLLL